MNILTSFAVVSVLLASIYGAFLIVGWLRVNGRQHARAIATSVGAFVAAVAAFAPVAPAYAQTTLDFDLTPFFDSLNVYLPIFIGLFAIVGGIAGAIALARYVINAVVDAFKGGSL
jgi:hypothetical protein